MQIWARMCITSRRGAGLGRNTSYPSASGSGVPLAALVSFSAFAYPLTPHFNSPNSSACWYIRDRHSAFATAQPIFKQTQRDNVVDSASSAFAGPSASLSLRLIQTCAHRSPGGRKRGCFLLIVSRCINELFCVACVVVIIVRLLLSTMITGQCLMRHTEMLTLAALNLDTMCSTLAYVLHICYPA